MKTAITTSVLLEMGEVVRATPCPGAQSVEVARWYLRKARLLDHIAAEGGIGSADAVELAQRARQRAAELDGRNEGVAA